MIWVLYAMFMFHPENNIAWRITEDLNFRSFTECQLYYYKYEKNLVSGLKNHMIDN